MVRYGRLYKNVVVAVIELPVGHSIEEHVGVDQADNYLEIPDDVNVGYFQTLSGAWLTPEQSAARKAKGGLHVPTTP
jgi:hypothetical protein